MWNFGYVRSSVAVLNFDLYRPLRLLSVWTNICFCNGAGWVTPTGMKRFTFLLAVPSPMLCAREMIDVLAQKAVIVDVRVIFQ